MYRLKIIALLLLTLALISVSLTKYCVPVVWTPAQNAESYALGINNSFQIKNSGDITCFEGSGPWVLQVAAFGKWQNAKLDYKMSETTTYSPGLIELGN